MNKDVPKMVCAIKRIADTGGTLDRPLLIAAANELESLRHGLDCRQDAEGQAHKLFHEPLEYAPNPDWATIHSPGDGPDHDQPANFVRILRKHLNAERNKSAMLRRALVGLIGADGRDDLNAMATIIRVSGRADADVFQAAFDALTETLPS